jgi:hypothetical protein
MSRVLLGLIFRQSQSESPMSLSFSALLSPSMLGRALWHLIDQISCLDQSVADFPAFRGCQQRYELSIGKLNLQANSLAVCSRHRVDSSRSAHNGVLLLGRSPDGWINGGPRLTCISLRIVKLTD